MKAVALCAHLDKALEFWRRLAADPGVDLRLVVCSPGWPRQLLGIRSGLPLALRLWWRGTLAFTRHRLDDRRTLLRLRALGADVGLHATDVIYRGDTLAAFRLGILNAHIGLLPRYRGRSVMEWSILQGDPAGVTVFFMDEGIDTGPRIVTRREVDLSRFRSVEAAKGHLFSLDVEMYAEALARLRDPDFAPLPNGPGGRRHYVMSRLFRGVASRILGCDASPERLD